MDGFSKYSFSGINIKKKVASRFRRFSKQISKSNTEALEAMLNFFDWNDLSPDDNLGQKSDGTKKRINALIAIVKNIEKHQTQPTTIMLQRLFEEASKEEEEYDFETPSLETEQEELTYYRDAYYESQRGFNTLKKEFEEVVQKITYIKNNFGTGYFRLQITKDEFEQLKQKLTNVYHHNSTETRE